MLDILLSSISTIKNFMWNSSRSECNDYLLKALQEAVECMELRVPEEVKNTSPIKSGYGVYCPNCGLEIRDADKKPNYCQVCGKSLLYPEEDPLAYTE